METIWIVYILVNDDNCSVPYVNFNGGIERPYAVCSNEDNAEKIKSELNRIGTLGLQQLKIIEKDEHLTKAFISYPMRVDNDNAILNKLGSV